MESINDFEEKYKELTKINVLKVSKDVDLTIDYDEPYVINIIAFDSLYKRRFERKERVEIFNRIKEARQDIKKLKYKTSDEFTFIKDTNEKN